ncbi:PASTA domain-containing protein [Thermotoga neapolitana]|nr:PASTA domain-containing protein [Thermotoga neapolitana]
MRPAEIEEKSLIAMKVFLGILTGVVTGGLLFLLTIKLYQNQFVIVPDVTGLSGTKACEKLKESGLLCDRASTETVVDTYPQSVSKVKKGRIINLYYENPLKDVIPRFVGVKLSVVEEILNKLGWNYEVVRFPFGEEKDKVLATYPEAGKLYNGKLTLLVDTGEKEEYFVVENYVGKSPSDVEKEDNVIFVGSGSRVVSQYPPAGSIATEVILILGEE